jgi:hypothetical protein
VLGDNSAFDYRISRRSWNGVPPRGRGDDPQTPRSLPSRAARPKPELLEVKRLRSNALVDWGGSGVRQKGLEGECGGSSNSLQTGPPSYPSQILDLQGLQRDGLRKVWPNCGRIVREPLISKRSTAVELYIRCSRVRRRNERQNRAMTLMQAIDSVLLRARCLEMRAGSNTCLAGAV